MRGVVSFHAVDPQFFEALIEPLLAGAKVNPETFLEDARRVRATAWQVEGYKLALGALLPLLGPPAPPRQSSVWRKVRARLEAIDFKPDPTARLIAGKLERDLHLEGRPFLITEGSAGRVSSLLDDYERADGPTAVEALVLEQLVRLDPRLPAAIRPREIPAPGADASYRAELLQGLRDIYDAARAGREGNDAAIVAPRHRDHEEPLSAALPWRAVELHSRCHPCWIARDVDGLATICRAAQLDPPACLEPAGRLFRSEEHGLPALGELTAELTRSRDVGALVRPERIGELLAFLAAEGSHIIRAASRHGEGEACATLLRKIRECARHAERRGRGYLEACGVTPLVPPIDDDEEEPAEQL